jgi:hypothetical protein
MRSPVLSRLAFAALILALAACATTNVNTSNKWRLQFSGYAETDGTILLQLLTVGAVTAEVPVAVVGGSSENQVARRVSEELKLVLPADRYDVEVDDGEDVLIKRRGGTDDFEVRVVSNTARGVRIGLDRE